MARPETPSSFHDDEKPAVVARPQPARSSSREKVSAGYRLFPTIAAVEPTPPATPITLQRLSLSKASRPPRSRSVSFDSTGKTQLQPQNAAGKAVASRRRRKGSVDELKHMSTVQEIPSPTVSIPYSFLPRSSEDTGHTRSNSAPGEFVRDSQTLPGARVDLSKPQWTSKQAETHPAKGLGLSIPASVSVDRLDRKRDSPSTRTKPNLTIEIKNDARLKPNAVVVREQDIDYDQPPPPPPPKSPRHDSRNQSLSNISEAPRKVRRTQSRRDSRSSSKASNGSQESTTTSKEANVASHGSFVKASLVQHTSSPNSPAPSKLFLPHARQESSRSLVDDVKIKELMTMSTSDAQDDLERPIPPPITPGQPRVASMARVVSISSLRSAATDKSNKQEGEKSEKPAITQNEAKSTETIVPVKQVESKAQEEDRPIKSIDESTAKRPPARQDAKPESTPIMSPAPSSTSSKLRSTRAAKPNLDKPMPSLPPPSSRFSEHMRQVRAAEGNKEENAPPVPAVPASKTAKEEENEKLASAKAAEPSAKPASSVATQPKAEAPEGKQVEVPVESVRTGNEPKAAQETAKTVNRPEKVSKGVSLSAFPAIPPPPRYYGRPPRDDSPSGRLPPSQRPVLRDPRRQEPPSRQNPPPRQGHSPDISPAHRFPPGHPMYRHYAQNIPGSSDAPVGPQPPRSRFYGREPESPNPSQVSLAVKVPTGDAKDGSAARGIATSPQTAAVEQPPAKANIEPQAKAQTPPIEHRSMPILETKPETSPDTKQQLLQKASDVKQTGEEKKQALLAPIEQSPKQDLLKRPQSPANLARAPSPAPSFRPSSAGDLLSKFSSAKTLPSLPPEPGPRPITPDAASIITADTKATISDPVQVLQDLTKQSEALHARHASLRADRLKLSTTISASLRDSKPGPEYANALLDQHLSLNALNSSLDICFAKLKSLDCKKEEAIQALIEQMRAKQEGVRRHKVTASIASQSTQASMSRASSKTSTPEIGHEVLPALHEQEPRWRANGSNTSGSIAHSAQSSVASTQESRSVTSATDDGNDDQRDSMVEGLPTPKPTLTTTTTPQPGEKRAAAQDINPVDKRTPSPEQKRNTAVKMPKISPPPSLFAGDAVEMSPVSPIDDNDNYSAQGLKRITVKGAKAAKVLGLVAGRSESPSGITLPDSTSSLSSPSKELTVEVKIQRKPVPGPPKTAAAVPPARQAPMPPQPGRKRTNNSASTVQTDSSPESEVRTPRGSQDALLPSNLKIEKKVQQQQQQQVQRPPVQAVQVVNSDDDILDYYAR